MRIFKNDADFEAFENVLAEAVERTGMRLLAYCVLPNHWHLVVWPRHDGELSEFVGWLTLTHTQRWHAFLQSSGSGHLYQGRFKSFPVEDDSHFFAMARYVERNAPGTLVPHISCDTQSGSSCQKRRFGRSTGQPTRFKRLGRTISGQCWRLGHTKGAHLRAKQVIERTSAATRCFSRRALAGQNLRPKIDEILPVSRRA